MSVYPYIPMGYNLLGFVVSDHILFIVTLLDGLPLDKCLETVRVHENINNLWKNTLTLPTMFSSFYCWVLSVPNMCFPSLKLMSIPTTSTVLLTMHCCLLLFYTSGTPGFTLDYLVGFVLAILLVFCVVLVCSLFCLSSSCVLCAQSL